MLQRQLPREGHLLRAHTEFVGDRRDGRVVGAHAARAAYAAEGAPREEGGLVCGAIVQLALAGTELGRELVLHRHELATENLVGHRDLLDGHIRDPRHPDDPVVE